MYIYLVDPGKARGCSTKTYVTDWLSHRLVKIYLRHFHAQKVKNGASSQETIYIDIFSDDLTRA